MQSSLAKRIIAIALALLVPTQSLLAQSAESRFWENRRQSLGESQNATPQYAALPTLPPTLPKLPSAISNSSSFKNQVGSSPIFDRALQGINPAMATVEETFVGQNSRRSPLILVQDVHLNVEAQENIAKIISALTAREEHAAVAIEGAFAPLDFSWYRKYPNQSAVHSVASKFFKSAELAAPSYVGLTAQQEVEVNGIDDETAYVKNVAAYRAALEIMPATLDEIKLREEDLNSRMASMNPSLRKLEELQSSLAQKKIGLGIYLRQLSQLQPCDDLVIQRFLEASALESSLDYKRVDEERKQVLERLIKSLTATELTALVAESVAYRTGEIPFGRFYQHLKDLCASKQIALRSAPAFDDYIRYVLLADGIKASDLFSRIEQWESSLKKTFIRTNDERALVEQWELLRLEKKLIEFALTPKEWEQYKRVRSATNDADLDSFERFYEAADERSALMVNKLSSTLTSTTKSDVLIVGGFHTPAITEDLRAKNISYVVLSPKLTKADGDGSSYLTVFAREKTPLDKLFAGEKLFLAPLDRNIGDKGLKARLQDEILQTDHPSVVPRVLRPQAMKRMGEALVLTALSAGSIALAFAKGHQSLATALAGTTAMALLGMADVGSSGRDPSDAEIISALTRYGGHFEHSARDLRVSQWKLQRLVNARGLLEQRNEIVMASLEKKINESKDSSVKEVAKVLSSALLGRGRIDAEYERVGRAWGDLVQRILTENGGNPLAVPGALGFPFFTKMVRSFSHTRAWTYVQPILEKAAVGYAVNLGLAERHEFLRQMTEANLSEPTLFNLRTLHAETIQSTLEQANGDRKEAARLLGFSVNRLDDWTSKYDLPTAMDVDILLKYIGVAELGTPPNNPLTLLASHFYVTKDRMATRLRRISQNGLRVGLPPLPPINSKRHWAQRRNDRTRIASAYLNWKYGQNDWRTVADKEGPLAILLADITRILNLSAPLKNERQLLKILSDKETSDEKRDLVKQKLLQIPDELCFLSIDRKEEHVSSVGKIKLCVLTYLGDARSEQQLHKILSDSFVPSMAKRIAKESGERLQRVMGLCDVALANGISKWKKHADIDVGVFAYVVAKHEVQQSLDNPTSEEEPENESENSSGGQVFIAPGVVFLLAAVLQHSKGMALFAICALAFLPFFMMAGAPHSPKENNVSTPTYPPLRISPDIRWDPSIDEAIKRLTPHLDDIQKNGFSGRVDFPAEGFDDVPVAGKFNLIFHPYLPTWRHLSTQFSNLRESLDYISWKKEPPHRKTDGPLEFTIPLQGETLLSECPINRLRVLGASYSQNGQLFRPSLKINEGQLKDSKQSIDPWGRKLVSSQRPKPLGFRTLNRAKYTFWIIQEAESWGLPVAPPLGYGEFEGLINEGQQLGFYVGTGIAGTTLHERIHNTEHEIIQILVSQLRRPSDLSSPAAAVRISNQSREIIQLRNQLKSDLMSAGRLLRLFNDAGISNLYFDPSELFMTEKGWFFALQGGRYKRGLRKDAAAMDQVSDLLKFLRAFEFSSELLRRLTGDETYADYFIKGYFWDRDVPASVAKNIQDYYRKESFDVPALLSKNPGMKIILDIVGPLQVPKFHVPPDERMVVVRKYPNQVIIDQLKAMKARMKRAVVVEFEDSEKSAADYQPQTIIDLLGLPNFSVYGAEGTIWIVANETSVAKKFEQLIVQMHVRLGGEVIPNYSFVFDVYGWKVPAAATAIALLIGSALFSFHAPGHHTLAILSTVLGIIGLVGMTGLSGNGNTSWLNKPVLTNPLLAQIMARRPDATRRKLEWQNLRHFVRLSGEPDFRKKFHFETLEVLTPEQQITRASELLDLAKAGGTFGPVDQFLRNETVGGNDFQQLLAHCGMNFSDEATVSHAMAVMDEDEKFRQQVTASVQALYLVLNVIENYSRRAESFLARPHITDPVRDDELWPIQDLPSTAHSLESIFGSDIRIWFKRQHRENSVAKRKEVANVLVSDPNLWKAVEAQHGDFPFALVRYCISNKIDWHSTDMDALLVDMKSAALPPRNNQIPAIAMSLRDYLMFRLSLTDSRVQEYLHDKTFLSYDREEKLAGLVSFIRTVGFPFWSESMAAIYDALPPTVSDNLSSKDFGRIDVTTHQFFTIRSILELPRWQEYLAKYLKLFTKEEDIASFFLLFGPAKRSAAIASLSPAQVWSALPKSVRNLKGNLFATLSPVEKSPETTPKAIDSTILVIEDDPNDQILMHRHLKKLLGTIYQVKFAANLQEAEKQMRELAAAGKLRLVITDYKFPQRPGERDSYSGEASIALAKELNVPVILRSGIDFQIVKAKPDAMIPKEAGSTILEATLKKFFTSNPITPPVNPPTLALGSTYVRAALIWHWIGAHFQKPGLVRLDGSLSWTSRAPPDWFAELVVAPIYEYFQTYRLDFLSRHDNNTPLQYYSRLVGINFIHAFSVAAFAVASHHASFVTLQLGVSSLLLMAFAFVGGNMFAHFFYNALVWWAPLTARRKRYTVVTPKLLKANIKLLNRLTPEQASYLRKRFIDKLSASDIAREEKVRRQATHIRETKAKAAFLKLVNAKEISNENLDEESSSFTTFSRMDFSSGKQAFERVGSLLKYVDPALVTIMRLRFQENKAINEIAALMGMNIESTNGRLLHSGRMLRNLSQYDEAAQTLLVQRNRDRLQYLEERNRWILSLRYIEKLSIDRIAEGFGMDVQDVFALDLAAVDDLYFRLATDGFEIALLQRNATLLNQLTIEESFVLRRLYRDGAPADVVASELGKETPAVNKIKGIALDRLAMLGAFGDRPQKDVLLEHLDILANLPLLQADLLKSLVIDGESKESFAKRNKIGSDNISYLRQKALQTFADIIASGGNDDTTFVRSNQRILPRLSRSQNEALRLRFVANHSTGKLAEMRQSGKSNTSTLIRLGVINLRTLMMRDQLREEARQARTSTGRPTLPTLAALAASVIIFTTGMTPQSPVHSLVGPIVFGLLATLLTLGAAGTGSEAPQDEPEFVDPNFPKPQDFIGPEYRFTKIVRDLHFAKKVYPAKIRNDKDFIDQVSRLAYHVAHNISDDPRYMTYKALSIHSDNPDLLGFIVAGRRSGEYEVGRIFFLINKDKRTVKFLVHEEPRAVPEETLQQFQVMGMPQKMIDEMRAWPKRTVLDRHLLAVLARLGWENTELLSKGNRQLFAQRSVAAIGSEFFRRFFRNTSVGELTNDPHIIFSSALNADSWFSRFNTMAKATVASSVRDVRSYIILQEKSGALYRIDFRIDLSDIGRAREALAELPLREQKSQEFVLNFMMKQMLPAQDPVTFDVRGPDQTIVEEISRRVGAALAKQQITAPAVNDVSNKIRTPKRWPYGKYLFSVALLLFTLGMTPQQAITTQNFHFFLSSAALIVAISLFTISVRRYVQLKNRLSKGAPTAPPTLTIRVNPATSRPIAIETKSGIVNILRLKTLSSEQTEKIRTLINFGPQLSPVDDFFYGEDAEGPVLFGAFVKIIPDDLNSQLALINLESKLSELKRMGIRIDDIFFAGGVIKDVSQERLDRMQDGIFEYSGRLGYIPFVTTKSKIQRVTHSTDAQRRVNSINVFEEENPHTSEGKKGSTSSGLTSFILAALLLFTTGMAPRESDYSLIVPLVFAAFATLLTLGAAGNGAGKLKAGSKSEPAEKELTQDQIKSQLGSVFDDIRKEQEATSLPLLKLFNENWSYFKRPERMEAFLTRWARYKNQVLNEIDPKLFSNASLTNGMLFLMIVRGTIKDLVWENGKLGRQGIARAEGIPEKLFNLSDGNELRALLPQVKPLLKDAQFISPRLEFMTGHTFLDFELHPDLFTIFADEFSQAVVEALDARERKLKGPENAAARKAIEEMRKKILAPFSLGDLRFELTGRNIRFLRGGKMAGDCTAPGSMNYWTLGAWNAAFENFELWANLGNEFFARFIFVVGTSHGRLALWIHGIEFSPLTRPGRSETAIGSELAKPALQLRLLRTSLQFLEKFSKRAGIKHLFLTEITNSHGFVDILPSLIERMELDLSEGTPRHDFRLLNGLNSVHSIKRKALNQLQGPESIYLQGWVGGSTFEPQAAIEADAEEAIDSNNIPFAGKIIDRGDLDRASRLLRELVNEALRAKRKSLDLFRESIENHSHLSPRDEAALLDQASVFDPGAQDSIKTFFNESREQLDKVVHQSGMSNHIKELLPLLLDDFYEIAEEIALGTGKRDEYLESPEEWHEDTGGDFSFMDYDDFAQKKSAYKQDLNANPMDSFIQKLQKSGVTFSTDPHDYNDDLINSVFASARNINKGLYRNYSRSDFYVAMSSLVVLLRSNWQAVNLLREDREALVPFWEAELNSLLADSRADRFKGGYARELLAIAGKFRSNINWLLEETGDPEDEEEVFQEDPPTGDAVMTVATKINPNLIGEFETKLRSSERYKDESIALMIAHPNAVLNYYQQLSQDIEGKGALQSTIEAIDLIGEAPKNSGAQLGAAAVGYLLTGSRVAGLVGVAMIEGPGLSSLMHFAGYPLAFLSIAAFAGLHVLLEQIYPDRNITRGSPAKRFFDRFALFALYPLFARAIEHNVAYAFIPSLIHLTYDVFALYPNEISALRETARLKLRAAFLNDELSPILSSMPTLNKPTFKKIGQFVTAHAPWRGNKPMPPAPFTKVLSEAQPAGPRKFNAIIAKLEEKGIKQSEVMADEQTVWQQAVTILANIHNFALGHFLMVPERLANLPQAIRSQDIFLALQAVAQSVTGRRRMGFNSLAAGASIDHLHIHGVELPEDVSPLEKLPKKVLLQREGVTLSRIDAAPFAGQCLVFSGNDFAAVSDAAGRYLSRLQYRDIAHSVVIAPNSVYIATLKHNVATALNNYWSFYEMMGYIVTTTDEHQQMVSDAFVKSQYRKIIRKFPEADDSAKDAVLYATRPAIEARREEAQQLVHQFIFDEVKKIFTSAGYSAKNTELLIAQMWTDADWYSNENDFGFVIQATAKAIVDLKLRADDYEAIRSVFQLASRYVGREKTFFAIVRRSPNVEVLSNWNYRAKIYGARNAKEFSAWLKTIELNREEGPVLLQPSFVGLTSLKASFKWIEHGKANWTLELTDDHGSASAEVQEINSQFRITRLDFFPEKRNDAEWSARAAKTLLEKAIERARADACTTIVMASPFGPYRTDYHVTHADSEFRPQDAFRYYTQLPSEFGFALATSSRPPFRNNVTSYLNWELSLEKPWTEKISDPLKKRAELVRNKLVEFWETLPSFEDLKWPPFGMPALAGAGGLSVSIPAEINFLRNEMGASKKHAQRNLDDISEENESEIVPGEKAGSNGLPHSYLATLSAPLSETLSGDPDAALLKASHAFAEFRSDRLPKADFSAMNNKVYLSRWFNHKGTKAVATVAVGIISNRVYVNVIAHSAPIAATFAADFVRQVKKAGVIEKSATAEINVQEHSDALFFWLEHGTAVPDLRFLQFHYWGTSPQDFDGSRDGGITSSARLWWNDKSTAGLKPLKIAVDRSPQCEIYDIGAGQRFTSMESNGRLYIHFFSRDGSPRGYIDVVDLSNGSFEITAHAEDEKKAAALMDFGLKEFPLSRQDPAQISQKSEEKETWLAKAEIVLSVKHYELKSLYRRIQAQLGRLYGPERISSWNSNGRPKRLQGVNVEINDPETGVHVLAKMVPIPGKILKLMVSGPTAESVTTVGKEILDFSRQLLPNNGELPADLQVSKQENETPRRVADPVDVRAMRSLAAAIQSRDVNSILGASEALGLNAVDNIDQTAQVLTAVGLTEWKWSMRHNIAEKRVFYFDAFDKTVSNPDVERIRFIAALIVHAKLGENVIVTTHQSMAVIQTLVQSLKNAHLIGAHVRLVTDDETFERNKIDVGASFLVGVRVIFAPRRLIPDPKLQLFRALEDVMDATPQTIDTLFKSVLAALKSA